MNAKPLQHYFRAHDDGWISLVNEWRPGGFAVTTARQGEGGWLRTTPDLESAQRLADATVPRAHACSNLCTGWVQVLDPGRKVEFATICPKGHAGAFTYEVGYILSRLHTVSFFCSECGRPWWATEEQILQLFNRVRQTIAQTDTRR